MIKHFRYLFHLYIGSFYRIRAHLRKFLMARKILRQTRSQKTLTIFEIADVIASTFRNAIDLLSLGVEDFKVASRDARRYATAVRNVYSGLLLIFKSHLMELTKADDCRAVFPDGISQGLSQKSANVSKILEEFDARGIVIDRKLFKRIRRYRNDIEHLFDSDKTKGVVVREYVVDMMLMAKTFMSDYMGLDPLEEVPHEVWITFLEEERIVEDERRRVIDALDGCRWVSPRARDLFETYVCEKCGGTMWSPDDATNGDAALSRVFKCRGCGSMRSYEDMMSALTDDIFKRTSVWWREGADGVPEFVGFGECPECSAVAFDCVDGVCFVCGHRESSLECNFCGERVTPDEMTCWNRRHLCCHCEYLMDKDD